MTNERVKPPTANADVRMRGFSRRTTVADVLAWLDECGEVLGAESVSLDEAAGRVLARPITSDVDVPGFDRAMMDGFAVRARDTQGASTYNRLALEVIGESLPGMLPNGPIGARAAAAIMTGAPIPAGADAVLPAEWVERQGERILVQGEVSPGKNIGRRAEDVRRGTEVLTPPRRLRPQDVGVLSSIGIGKVDVVRRPRVRIVVTGNELLPPGTRPSGVCVSDANGPMLAALVRRDGGIPRNPGIVADTPGEILTAMRDDADLVIVSGGSSVGREDYAPGVLAEQGELAIHGIAMRPSSPTGLGRLDGHLVILLPGNPVSCLCGYDFFAGRAIRSLGGRPRDWPHRSVRGTLLRKISSVIGRLDYARVKIERTGRGELQIGPLAIAGASILTSTTRADGFVLIAADSEGFGEGAEVDAYVYD